MKADTKNLVSMTEHSRNAAQHIKELQAGERLVLMRNDKPVAVLVAPEEIDELEDAAEDLWLTALALTRKALATSMDDSDFLSLDDVLKELGLTRSELSNAQDGEE